MRPVTGRLANRRSIPLDRASDGTSPVPSGPDGGRRVGPPSWLTRYRKFAVASDLISASVAAVVGYLVWYLGTSAIDLATHRDIYLVCCPLLPVVWLTVVACNRAYEGHFIGFGPAEFQRVFRSFLYLTLIVAAASYTTKTELARGFVVVALPLTLALSLLGRGALRRQLRRRRARGTAVSSVIVVGGAHAVIDLSARLRVDVHAGMRVVGACLPVEASDDAEILALLAEAELPLLGDIDHIRETVDAVDADIVAVASSHEIGAEKLRWISWQLEETDTDLVVSPGLVEVAGSRIHIRPIIGLPLLHVERPAFIGRRRLMKSGQDVFVAAVALILLAPLLLTIAVLIRLTSRGPALFRQTRVGRDGRLFTMIKFRSMTADAEDRLDEVAAHNDGFGLLFKIRDDPRVTPFGRWLRKHSLDELPQLLNIVAGQMSLVGPRPPLPSEVAKYQDHVHRRLLVKPGLTGLWQISGRSDLSWDESVNLDLRYVENWSPFLDFMILAKTLHAVTRSSGAY